MLYELLVAVALSVAQNASAREHAALPREDPSSQMLDEYSLLAWGQNKIYLLGRTRMSETLDHNETLRCLCQCCYTILVRWVRLGQQRLPQLRKCAREREDFLLPNENECRQPT